MLYEVWQEGFSCTGESAKATFIGSIAADSFAEACKKLCLGNKLFDPEKLTIWGCKLYPSETQARITFG